MAAKRKRRLDKKALIILGGILGVETIACGLAVYSLHGKKVAMEQNLAAREATLQNVRAVSASLPHLQAEYTQTRARLRFLEASLPPAEYIPTLLGQIERVAKTSGVKIGDFRPKAAPPAPPPASGAAPTTPAPEGPTQQQFDLTISGKYGDIQGFLQNLTQFRKILALESISIRPAKGGAKGVSPDLTGNLSFTAYLLPPETAPANPAPAVPNATASASTTEAERRG